jgi:hypothetical protein
LGPAKGETTAAVPVPHISFSAPDLAAAITSSMAIWRSETRSPQSRMSVSADSRVMLARIAP